MESGLMENGVWFVLCPCGEPVAAAAAASECERCQNPPAADAAGMTDAQTRRVRGRRTMARFQMDDGTVVDTKNATQSWDEETEWDGRNHISKATGSQWLHQTLYRSRKGRFYVVHESQYQGSRPHAEWVSSHEAARWLLANEHELPEELAALESEVSE
jgi:hypothetical protein